MMQKDGGRVFVLGSGFSAAMGLPTLANLFSEVMSREDRPGEDDKDQVFQALEILYPHFRRSELSCSYPPFEEFLSLVSSAKDLPFFPKGFWDIRWRSALRLLTDCLADKAKTAEESEVLNSFIQNLHDGDSVVTFNWDNLIERALFLKSRNLNFLERHADSVAVLKLHGSLNWAEIPEDVRLKYPGSVTALADRVVCSTDFTYYDLWDALDEPPLIIPPILSKNPPAHNFIRGIWQQAFSSIIEAKTVAIIGYSIPDDDLQARCLLRTSWAARDQRRHAAGLPLDSYFLLDPHPRVCGKYTVFVSNSMDYHQMYFTKELIPVLFAS